MNWTKSHREQSLAENYVNRVRKLTGYCARRLSYKGYRDYLTTGEIKVTNTRDGIVME